MVVEILIYEEIGYNWWTGGGVTASSVQNQIENAIKNGATEILVRINCIGGSVLEGIAIYNALAKNSDIVTTINEGVAYSMGAVIAMAGKKRKAYKNSTFMFHNVSGGVWGNAKDIKGALEMIEALDDSLCESIAQLTGKPSADIKAKYFDFQDHTLTASKALEEGLITELVEMTAENIPANISNMTVQEIMAHYRSKNSPANQETFFTKMKNEIFTLINKGKSTNTPVSDPQPNNSKTEDMKAKILVGMTALASIFAINFKENETEQEIEITPEHLVNLNTNLTDLQNKLSAAEAKIEALEKAPGAGETDPKNLAGKEGADSNKKSLSIQAPEAASGFNHDY